MLQFLRTLANICSYLSYYSHSSEWEGKLKHIFTKTNVHNQKLATIQMCMSRWLDGQIVVQLVSGCCSSLKSNRLQVLPHAKCVWISSHYVKGSRHRKVQSVWLHECEILEKENLSCSHRRQMRDWRKCDTREFWAVVQILSPFAGFAGCFYVYRTLWTRHFKWLCFIVSKLYLSEVHKKCTFY